MFSSRKTKTPSSSRRRGPIARMVIVLMNQWVAVVDSVYGKLFAYALWVPPARGRSGTTEALPFCYSLLREVEVASVFRTRRKRGEAIACFTPLHFCAYRLS